MNIDDKEHHESEFYYPTEDFTFSVPKRNEVLGPRNAMKSETSPTEEFREIQSLIESQSSDITR